MTKLRRRNVLGLLAALAARPALGTSPCRDDLLTRVCVRAGAYPEFAALGHAQCAIHPDVPSSAWITDLARTLPATALTSGTQIVRSLRERAIADFREGRIVDLDGWRVSVTEARICAAAVAFDDTLTGWRPAIIG